MATSMHPAHRAGKRSVAYFEGPRLKQAPVGASKKAAPVEKTEKSGKSGMPCK